MTGGGRKSLSSAYKFHTPLATHFNATRAIPLQRLSVVLRLRKLIATALSISRQISEQISQILPTVSMKMANLGGAIAITALIFAVLTAAVAQAEGNADQKVGISRFLAAATDYKTTKCSHTNGICEKEGRKSKSYVKLICCKQSCVNPLTDRYNCGACAKTCSFGYACCNGKCLNVAYDRNNCGRCGVTCSKKNKCIYGMCSYA